MSEWLYSVDTAGDVPELASKVNDLSSGGSEIFQIIHQPRPELAPGEGQYVKLQTDTYVLLVRHPR